MKLLETLEVHVIDRFLLGVLVPYFGFEAWADLSLNSFPKPGTFKFYKYG
jgi:hypothetical protein